MIVRPAALVTDIEGTTSDISFVQKVMFPYARQALPGYLQAHAQDPTVRPWIEQIAAEIGCATDDLDAVSRALIGWIDADRKHTALKALQGQVWESAFRSGEFVAHVYPDAVAALRRWLVQGLPMYVYSSGSIQAQKLYFGHTQDGDLRPCFRDYFDTTTGPKREAESYRRIAEAIAVPADRILFLSDIGAELDAARAAGWSTVQIVREGTTAAPEHDAVSSFDELGF
ncbi:MAG: acireductone synthase [Lysobacterales bacterium]